MKHHLKPYPKYKTVQEKWVGSVPDHWKMLPNRAIFAEIKERNFPDEQMLSVTISKGVIRQADLLATSSKKDSSNTDKTKYKLVCPGDIVYNKMRAWQGATGVSQYRGIVSPAYIVVRPREEQNPRYFHYLFRTPAFATEAERWSYGITSDQWSLRPEDFKQIYCCLPPMEEQSTIVRYLDHFDRRIRQYIRTKKRMITLFNEQKQAIIHRAVTRGLDPNMSLKPSGVEWLGDIPVHWEVRRLKQVVKILRGKFSHRPRNDPRMYDGPYPFIQTGEVSKSGKYLSNYRQTLSHDGYAVSKEFPKGTLVMTIAANIGDVAILSFDACFPDSILGFIPYEKVQTDYLYYVMRSQKGEFIRMAPVNTQGNLSVDRLGGVNIPIPLIVEQNQIVFNIEEKTKHLDIAISRAVNEIDLIHEYRKRIIADVVTGKLDIRGVAANLPDGLDDLIIGNNDESIDDYSMAEEEENGIEYDA